MDQPSQGCFLRVSGNQSKIQQSCVERMKCQNTVVSTKTYKGKTKLFFFFFEKKKSQPKRHSNLVVKAWTLASHHVDVNAGSPTSQWCCLGYLSGLELVLSVKTMLTAPISLSPSVVVLVKQERCISRKKLLVRVQPHSKRSVKVSCCGYGAVD